jgi:hypothetical protein
MEIIRDWLGRLMEIIPNWLGPLIGVVVGFMLNMVHQHFQETWFGPRLIIDCQTAPGRIGQGPNAVWMKFRVRNMNKRRVARNCRAYLIAIHQISNNRVVPDDLNPDSVQLSWEGGDFEPRDIPYGASQYADIVHFPKDQDKPDWQFLARPNYLNRDLKLKGYRGTYRFSVIVAGDGATPATKKINVDYNGDWRNARPYDA